MGVQLEGREVIEALAARFPQLYVAPGEGAEEANRLAASRGIAPENADLDHFETDPEDSLREVETPAGPVEVVFWKRRGDFETFLQIIGHRSRPDAIARTVGAMTYRGLPDWGKVDCERRAYFENGGTDWTTEFKRLASQPGAFRAEIVVISEGPYSNVSARETPYEEDEWVRISREVRLHHECAHVVCRRTMPDDVLPVWDEVTADVVGLLCATGCYDVRLASLFLGVTEQGFTGGRLAEYLDDDQRERIDEIAAEVYCAITRVHDLSDGAASRPFDFLLDLKKAPLIRY